MKSKWNENKSTRNKWGPPRVHRMNWKVRFRELTGWRPKNDKERLKIFSKSPTETLRKRLGLDFLHGNNFPHWFLVNKKCQEGWTPSFFTPPSIYRKIGEELATQLAQTSSARLGEPGCFLQKQPPPRGRTWKAQVGLIAICTPFFFY